MRPAANDGDFDRAGEIIAASRIGTLAVTSWQRLREHAGRSRTAAALRQPWRASQSMSAGDRRRAAVFAVGVALIGHIVLAALEPEAARPTIALTALAWLATVAAAIAASRRNSTPGL